MPRTSAQTTALKEAKSSKPQSTTSTIPSRNWFALQKTLATVSKKSINHASGGRKRRRLSSPLSVNGSVVESVSKEKEINEPGSDAVASLRSMVSGESVSLLSPSQRLPGKYVALDCEMVGVGIDGTESSLARVSIVNYHGHVLLDAFVRQQERVVDYRTQWSGIRPVDMKSARSFADVQKDVASLLEDRILVGHAVHNDLKSLLLSHPHTATRDTQLFARKNRLPQALRHLVRQKLGITIQEGEHDSVIDARATMALYRLNRKAWEAQMPPPPISAKLRGKRKAKEEEQNFEKALTNRKRKRNSTTNSSDEGVEVDQSSVSVSQKTGISSGFSTVVRRGGAKTIVRHTGRSSTKRPDRHSAQKATSELQWWKELPDVGGNAQPGKKGSIKIKLGV